MALKNKNFNFSILSLFILTGFIIGLTKSVLEITSNRYIFHKMYFLILLTLKNHLTVWCISFALIGLIISFCLNLLKRNFFTKKTLSKVLSFFSFMVISTIIVINLFCFSKK